jgi:hypothetical protein
VTLCNDKLQSAMYAVPVNPVHLSMEAVCYDVYYGKTMSCATVRRRRWRPKVKSYKSEKGIDVVHVGVGLQSTVVQGGESYKKPLQVN